MSIIEDMTRRKSLAMGAREWRIGLNARHAFMADLHARDLWDARKHAPPTRFLGIVITWVTDHTSWELIAMAWREPEAELYDDCS